MKTFVVTVVGVLVVGVLAFGAPARGQTLLALADSTRDSTSVSAPGSGIAGAAAGAAATAAGSAVPVKNLDMKISAYPYAYYTPETEPAVGAGGIVTFYTGTDKV